MDIEIHSKNKTNLTGGKKYIGSGLFRDGDGFVWNLSKDAGGGWMISRSAKVKRTADSVPAQKYWESIFYDAVRSKTAKQKLVVQKLASYPDAGHFMHVVDFILQDDDFGEFKMRGNLVVNENQAYFVVRSVNSGIEKQIIFPPKLAEIVTSFDVTETTNILSDIVSSDGFSRYIAYELSQ
jgi:hypothetical protein